MAKLDDVIKDLNKKTKEQVVTVGLPTYDNTAKEKSTRKFSKPFHSF